MAAKTIGYTKPNAKNYFIIYTLVFAVMAFAVFGVFFITGQSFIIKPDGWQQHYKALIYYADWLRSVLKTIFIDHSFSIPTFSFSIGYGSDILTTLHYYVIGDPLTLLSVFVPEKWMAGFYEFLIFLRLYLAGGAFSLFCFYKADQMQRKGNAVPAGTSAMLVGSFVYLFCGYTLFLGIRHPYFLNPLIYLPLVFIGVEKILDGKRPWMFIAMVCLSSVSNFYFFYMIVILTVLYVVWRLIDSYSRKEWKTAGKKLWKIAWSSILGTCMSAFMLFPILYYFVNSSRAETGGKFHFLYTLQEYADYLGNYIAWDDVAFTGSTNTNICFAVIVLITALLLFLQKGHKDLKIGFLFLTAMTLLPAAGSFMNGLSYVSNRWIFGYGFLASYLVVVKWKDLLSLSKREKQKLSLCFTVCLVLCVVLSRGSTAVYFALAMGVLLIVLICLAGVHTAYSLIQTALVVCILANIAGNAFFIYSPVGFDYASKFESQDKTQELLNKTEEAAVKAVSGEEEGFFRYTGEKITKNGTLLSGLNSTQYYWSMSNANLKEFRENMALSDQISAYDYRDLDSRTFLSTLANVKYYVQDDTVPYGFSYVGSFNSAGEEGRKYKIWENDCFLPFGYTYDQYIPSESYASLTPLEKQEALLQGCVIDSDEAEGTENDKIALTGVSLPYSVQSSDGLEFENGHMKVTQENAKLTLTFEGMENAETYLYLEGLRYSKAASGLPSGLSKEKSKIKIELEAVETNGETHTKTLTYYTPYYSWYGGRDSFMVHFGYQQNALSELTLTFRTTGEYDFDSLEILCQGMENYRSQISALAEDVLENVDFHENDVYATNKVTGTISLKSDKYLLMTIPYSDGWTAYIDGEQQPLLEANTMYMALYLPAGDHEIELHYATPGLNAGLLASGCFTAGFLLLIILGERKRKKQILNT